MQDLLRAAAKAVASGLGDWHLQALQDASPWAARRVLAGALGPEALRHTHGLDEAAMLRLYGLLHRHCAGFQDEARSLSAAATQPRALLQAIWSAYAQLWDETAQAAFGGELLEMQHELDATHKRLIEAHDAEDALRAEAAAMRERMAELVRANLDHMLAWRTLKARADALDGEAWC